MIKIDELHPRLRRILRLTKLEATPCTCGVEGAIHIAARDAVERATVANLLLKHDARCLEFGPDFVCIRPWSGGPRTAGIAGHTDGDRLVSSDQERYRIIYGQLSRTKFGAGPFAVNFLVVARDLLIFDEVAFEPRRSIPGTAEKLWMARRTKARTRAEARTRAVAELARERGISPAEALEVLGL